MPDSKIRVVRIIARLNIGGPAIHATLLTERLDPARFTTTLVTGTEDDGEANYLELHGRTIPVLILPDLGREIRPQAHAVFLAMACGCAGRVPRRCS